jgi:hypothetical protein
MSKHSELDCPYAGQKSAAEIVKAQDPVYQ